MVTKWTQACDKRLHKLIAYIHHTSHWTQVCHVGDEPWDCWLALFVDASFAGDLTDSKSTSGSYLCLVGPRTFVPLSWMCKKQGAVSHSSSEAEVSALDAGTRMEGIPALLLWEVVLEVFPGPTTQTTNTPNLQTTSIDISANNIRPYQTHLHAPHDEENTFNHTFKSEFNIDYVPTNLPMSRGKGLLMIFEDNEAVIKMTIKGRSPNMHHVARTHRVDVDFLFERLRDDPGMFIKHVGTKEQIADIFTKGSFTTESWLSLCDLAQIGDPKRLTQPHDMCSL